MKPLLATQFAPQASQAEQTETEQRNCRAAIGHASPSDDEREVLVRSSNPKYAFKRTPDDDAPVTINPPFATIPLEVANRPFASDSPVKLMGPLPVATTVMSYILFQASSYSFCRGTKLGGFCLKSPKS
jgi:hypothetical protein